MQSKNKINSFFLFPFSFIFFLLSFVLFLSSCKKSTEPLYNTANLQLQVLDVSCTEAWLSLKAKSAYQNKTLKLFQNDSLKLEKTLTVGDSILFVENLWPNTSYQFKAEVYDDNRLLTKSATVTATTMDTTSHDFEWQTFEFGGQGGSSSFQDVAIIDENDIWAVGEIYTENEMYNAAHWNGKNWTLTKIKTNACGGVDYPPIKAVFAFSKNDIVFGHIDASITKYNGAIFVNDCSFIEQLNGSINKIWGTSSSNLYVVGNNGLISHYDGQQWQRIESRTDLPIVDVFGVLNQITNQYDVFCVVDGYGSSQGSWILRIKNNKVTVLWHDPRSSGLDEIWCILHIKYIVVGGGVWIATFPDMNWQEQTMLPLIHSTSIDAQSMNDIVISGAFLMLLHYNGMTWKRYFPFTSNSAFTSVQIKNNKIVAVGSIGTKSLIVMGKR